MLEIYVFKNIHVAIHTHMKSYTLQIIHVTNHTRMKWRHFIGRSATHPCLTKPSYCMSQCFASRQGLRDFAVKSMRPWRHRTPSLAGRCSVVTQRQSRRSCIISSGEYSIEHQPTCADNQIYSQAPINLIYFNVGDGFFPSALNCGTIN